MAPPGQNTNWTSIIANLPAEDKFFALALLLLDSFLSVLAVRSTGFQQLLLVLAVVFVFLVIVVLVWWTRIDQSRRAQHQLDSLTEHGKFAEGLADDICEAFEGSLANIENASEADRQLPYSILCEIVRKRAALSEAETRFAEVLVHRVEVKAGLKGMWAAKETSPAEKTRDEDR